MTQTTEERLPGNWGRWGPDDERGAMNLVTAEAVVKAARLVKKGSVYSLGLPINRKAPGSDIRNPSLHLMQVDGGAFAAGSVGPGNVQMADDYIFMACHGGTHIDAFSHTWYDHKMYNGFSGNHVRSTSGARKLGIDKVPSIVTRGILLDIAAHKGVPEIEPPYIITCQDLEDCARAQGTIPEPGDTVLFRTGWLPVFWKDRARWEKGQPGIGRDSVDFIRKYDIAVIGADNTAVESGPWDAGPENLISPVHVECLRNLGVHMLELLDLEELAKDGSKEFLFITAPLPITGGVGSPINPLAVC